MTGVLVAVMLLVANGVFVAAEFAFIAARRNRLDQLADDGDPRAKAAVRSLGDLSQVLSAAQLGITIASLLLGYVAEPAVAGLLEEPFHAVGLGSAAAHTIAFVVALTIVAFLHLVVGEMVPKSIAIAEPDRTALVLARPLRAFIVALRPAIAVLNLLANAGLRLVGIEPKDELSEARTGEEIADVLAVSRREGVLEEVEHRLMTGALRFPAREVADVAIPRDAIAAVGADASPAELERRAVASGHSRIVVYGTDLDEVLGFVHAKDLLALAPAARDLPMPGRLVRRMLVLDGQRSLQQALLSMRRARIHAGLVVDGGGRTAGMVTLEDVLGALVGDVGRADAFGGPDGGSGS
ncbi:MAG: hemolysin family protein [Acidimicrobiia bacterium]